MASDWNKKVGEKDFVRLAIIIAVLVFGYFVYANFIPKNFESTLKIDIIEISTECVDCVNLSVISASLVDLGVEIDDHDVYASDSSEGKKMIEKYEITKVPALIVVSKKIDEVGIDEAFDVKDGYAVFGMNTPYIEVDSGKLRGVVNMIEIVPECNECFSLTSIKAQFDKMGISVGSYEIVGAESPRGLSLIEGLGLEFSPALLISRNIEEYDWIMPSLKGALTIKGEYYLFETPIAPYKDLADGNIKGIVDITSIIDSSCETCFDVDELKQSFQAMNVYFGDEKTLDISSTEGKKFAKKYNVTAVPTVVLSKEILDYPQLREILVNVGTFDESDQSFVFRDLKALGEFVEVEL